MVLMKDFHKRVLEGSDKGLNIDIDNGFKDDANDLSKVQIMVLLMVKIIGAIIELMRNIRRIISEFQIVQMKVLLIVKVIM